MTDKKKTFEPAETDINFHNVAKIELVSIRTLDKGMKTEFYTRKIRIIDTSGNSVVITAFSNDIEALTINQKIAL